MTGAPSRDPSKAAPLVEARGVSLRFGRRSVLDAVDIAVRAGEIVTLVGLNGAGKSTLIRVILGILEPDSGEVLQSPGLRVGYVPQHMQRDPVMPITVERFMTLGSPTPRKTLQRVLDEVGGDPILGHPLAEISGGEMQRVLLARALLREPQLLVLDEPLAGVDITSQSDLYRLIADIRDRRGFGVLLVSHDLHLVMAATDTVVCLNRHVCCTGRPQAVLQHPEFISLFGRHLSETFAVYQHAHDHRHDALGEPLSIEAGPLEQSRPAGRHR